MLSKATIKYIKSLQVKKYRKQEQSFVIEGAKTVQELLASDFEVLRLFATESFLSENRVPSGIDVLEVKESELDNIGGFQTNNGALAIARMKANQPPAIQRQSFVLVLDDIRDPGNLGTIIRTADWYGINQIVASNETADFYNSKVITSTMGSFTRVNIHYTDLEDFLSRAKGDVYGAYLDGKNVHDEKFDSGGFILIGNESHGIAPSLEKFVTDKITIPRYGKAESLNAGIATAIICDNIMRHR
ncbi:MAG TPA: RNA methyltransferase [Chryseosolibacter sp.]|nr:RNA methyltransferase [Chryseosolibacter sp.]